MENKSKYTPQMEQMLRDAAPLNQARATELAELFGEGFSARSVTAKAIRMGLAYERKQVVSKTGAPVEKKDAIVAEIASVVNANLDGLDKAPKQVLQRLRDFVKAA